MNASTSKADARSLTEGEEPEEKDVKEEWLKRNPKMASIITDSNPQQLDSEDSAANSEDEAPPTKAEIEAASSAKASGAGDGAIPAQGGDCDAKPSSDSIQTFHELTAADQPPISIQTLPHDQSNGREHSVPDAGKDVVSADTPASSAEGKSDQDASDIPKGLRASSQSKLKGSRPAGLTAAASAKGVPKGLSRGNNARGAASTFHGAGGAARSQQSASKLIAETFAKHNKTDVGGSSRGGEAIAAASDASSSSSQKNNSILTNANFNLVDRSKRVISDD